MKHAIFIACLAVVLAFAASAGILRECTLTAADLPGLASGVVLRLPAFDGRTVTVSLGERRTSANGLSTFGATVEGSCGRDAVAVQTEDGFVLRAKDPRTGRTLEFRRKGDALRVREREAAAPGPRTCTSRHFPSRQSDGKAAYLSRSALTGDPMVDGRRMLKGEVRTNVVDILMAYDASAAAWVRTESVFAGLPNSVEAFSAERIENMNNALVNTGLGDLFSFNLAGTLVITNNWDCRGSTEARQFEAFDRMLDALVSLKSGEQVRAAREACGADVVTFLVAANEYGTVGLSWSLDDNSIGQGDFDDYAYSVCSVSAVADGHTLTHEVGHTMGAGHADMSVAALAGPQLYGYSSGYTFAVTNALGETIGLYHTIMGYDRDGLVHPGAEDWDWAAEVPYFSSPNYTFAYEDEDPASGAPTVVDTGIPVGDARHDNTRLLAAVYPLVANFRVRKSSVTVVTPDGGGTAGPATGFGLLNPGESVTLKAVAATGYVFAGWYGRYDEADGTYAAPIAFDGGTDYRATSGKWTMPAGEVRSVRLYARFVRAEADAECRPTISLEPAEDGSEAGKEIAPIVVTVDSLSLPTVTVKGLPSGLKFDAKALKIVGTPTKPGVYEVSVGARNKSRVTGEATVSVKVNNFTDPLVSWDESSNPEGLLDCYGPLVPGVPVSVAIPPARGWSASGLPSGLKFDGKTGLLSGAPTKPGTFTATFKATLKDPATGKSAAHVATATFVVDALRTLSVVKTGDSTGTGKLSGAGAYVAGKKVTVKATADTKDTATTKRSVFMAWYDGETLLSRNASYSYTMTADAEQTLSAKFITAEEDAASIALAVDGTELDADKPEERTLVCGVALVWDVAHEALSQTTVKASGLPSGLKLVQDKVTKAYVISGAPTAESKLAKDGVTRTPSSAKITVTTAGKSSRTYLVNLTVLPLDPWAVGTFNGGGEACQATLTVAKTGKTRGKLLAADGTWTLSATSFDARTEDGVYTLSVVGKNGKALTTNRLEVAAAEIGGSRLGVALDGEDFLLRQNPWSVEPWKTESKAFARAEPLVLTGERHGLAEGESLALKFGASGKVTVAGRFLVGTAVKSVSGSAVLVPSGDGGRFALNVFLAPKAPFAGYCSNLDLTWDGTAFALSEEDEPITE